MIFVTVGEQLPFDRLISAVDDWASDSGEEVFAQIGNSQLKPNIIQYKKHLDPIEFKRAFLAADVIIAHAGMGTIITALELGKPLLVMPRQACFGEHRNDHQLATAKRFLKQGYISVAFDVPELMEKLGSLSESTNINRTTQDVRTSNKLIKVIKDFIFDTEI
ncbi:MAG: glycosyltransferase [Legionellaceae bacterium]|nr:glycosyltransferase [Legionellaceae bacterium]